MKRSDDIDELKFERAVIRVCVVAFVGVFSYALFVL